MPGNPCPFLRALVEHGAISDGVEPLGHVSSTVAKAFDQPGREKILAALVYEVALTANGLGPKQIIKNRLHGMDVEGLRDGPFDKHGTGSRILDKFSVVDEAELDRLDEFASDFVDPESGLTERGLSADGVEAMLDANFERAKETRRAIDRRLMDAEFPKLLEAMGKDSPDGLYLSIAEVRVLFIERRLPDRVANRLL